MAGMSNITGKPLGGIAHLRQSVGVILNTPVGSRVMRREFGSRVHELVDRPSSAALLAEINAAAADALGRWEPRLRLRQVRARRAGSGHLEIDLQGQYLPDGRPIRLEGISLAAAAAGWGAEPEAPRGAPAAIRAALSGGSGILAGKVIADQGAASRIRASLSGGPGTLVARVVAEPEPDPSEVQASLTGGPGTLSARVTAQPSSLVRTALSGGPGTLSAAVTAEAAPAPEPAGTRLDSILAQQGEIVRALLESAPGDTWYSRFRGEEIGSLGAGSDLQLNANLPVQRVTWLPGSGSLRLNGAAPDPLPDSAAASSYRDYFGSGGPGEGKAVHLLFEGLDAPIVLPFSGRTLGSGGGYVNLDADLADMTADDAYAAALERVGDEGLAVNLVIADAPAEEGS